MMDNMEVVVIAVDDVGCDFDNNSDFDLDVDNSDLDLDKDKNEGFVDVDYNVIEIDIGGFVVVVVDVVDSHWWR